MNPSDAPTPPASSPTDVVQALNTLIKALVVKHGDPQATVPLSITEAIPTHQLQAAAALTLTIRQVTNDVDPVPFILITIEGI